MRCEECGEREATVYVSLTVNGEKKERHLCAECARRVGEFEFMVEPQFSLQSLLASLLQGAGGQGVLAPAGAACPACRLTYAQFAQAGRLGCSECYRTFERQLEPLLRRIHGSSVHAGKVPRSLGAQTRARRKLSNLREELERAVRREDYERAAQLRDEIRKIEAGEKGGAGGGVDDSR